MTAELWQWCSSGWCFWQVRLYVEIMDASLKCCYLWGKTTAVTFMANEVVESKNPCPNLLHLASLLHCDHYVGKLLDVYLTRHLQRVHSGVPFISSTVLIKVKTCRYVFVCLSFESNTPLYFSPAWVVNRTASKQHGCPSSYLHFWCFSDCRCTQTSFCCFCNWLELVYKILTNIEAHIIC